MEKIEVVELEDLFDSEEELVALMDNSGSCRSSGH